MGVYVKTMKMQDSCTFCPFFDEDKCHALPLIEVLQVRRKIEKPWEKPDWCPLEEIAPCEDCKYFYYDKHYNRCWCNRTYGAIETKPEHFCSHWKRK